MLFIIVNTYYVLNSDIFVMSFPLCESRTFNQMIHRDIIRNPKFYVHSSLLFCCYVVFGQHVIVAISVPINIPTSHTYQ